MLPSLTRRTYRPFYMPDLFNDDLFNLFPARSNSMPAVNIREDEKNYTLELAVPGMNKDDLRIDVNEDMLTIATENKQEKEEKKEGYQRKEFSYTSFCRSFYLPDNVNKEKISANYRDGILFVEIPKQEEEKNKISRQIKIS